MGGGKFPTFCYQAKRKMIDKAQVRPIVADYIKDKEGYFIVDVKVGKDNNILVEVDSAKGFSIDECEELTRYIESRLDREVEDYELEVGSPGLSSPFKVKEQYAKYEGEEVEVLDADGKKHNGRLTQVTPENFGLEETRMEKPEGSKRKVEVKTITTFDYDKIKYTKYTIRFK